MAKKPTKVRADIAEMEAASAAPATTTLAAPLSEVRMPELPEGNSDPHSMAEILDPKGVGDLSPAEQERAATLLAPGEEEVRMAPVIQKALDGFEKSVIEDQIETLRPRVRVPEGAGITEVLQAIIDGKWSRKVLMLTPFNRSINPHAHYVMMAHIRKNPWLGYHYVTDTVIQRARNILAQHFLESEAEWAWWVDQDTVSPFGVPGFFYITFGANPQRIPPQFAGMHALPRLLSHKKTIVGAVYRQRKPNGTLVIQPELYPRGPDDKELVTRINNRGPFDSIYPAAWVATGCALIHRSVFEAIKTKFPDKEPKHPKQPWNFFGEGEVEESGEDIHFCKLAAQAGHQSFLDTGLFCAHIGEFSYLP